MISARDPCGSLCTRLTGTRRPGGTTRRYDPAVDSARSYVCARLASEDCAQGLQAPDTYSVHVRRYVLLLVRSTYYTRQTRSMCFKFSGSLPLKALARQAYASALIRAARARSADPRRRDIPQWSQAAPLRAIEIRHNLENGCPVEKGAWT